MIKCNIISNSACICDHIEFILHGSHLALAIAPGPIWRKLFRYRITSNEDATCKMSIHPVALGAAAAAAAAALITEQCRPAGGLTPILPPHAASPLSDHRHSPNLAGQGANLLSIEVHRLRALLRRKRGEAVWERKLRLRRKSAKKAKWQTSPFLTPSPGAQVPPAPVAPQPCAFNPRLALRMPHALEVR